MTHDTTRRDTPDVQTWLTNLHLAKGAHLNAEAGTCLMEALALFAREPHTDRSRHVSPVLGAFMRAHNDALPDVARQRLKKYMPRLLGSAAGEEVEAARARLAQNWYIRLFTSLWLGLAGHHHHAEALWTLAPLELAEDFHAAQPGLDAAARDANEAGDAAGAAPWASAWDVAWTSTGEAAWDAAWAVDVDAPAAAALMASREAARASSRTAAWATAWDAKAPDALGPAVKRLHAAAVELLEAMLAVQQ